MFPHSLYPSQDFPNALFPGSGGSSSSSAIFGYKNVLTIFSNIVRNSGVFAPNNVALSLWPEPFPLAAGPACYVMPGSFRQDERWAGGGRYAYTYTGSFVARVVDRSLRDTPYRDTLRLTQSDPAGLLRTTHKLINATHVKFLQESATANRAVQPIVAAEQLMPKTYKQSGDWCYADVRYEATWTDDISEVLPDPTTGPPTTGTELADVLTSFTQVITDSAIFTPQQLFISLTQNPFPNASPPLCVVSPGRFRYNAPDTTGAGRYYATADGSIVVWLILQNLMDTPGRSDQVLANANPSYALLTRMGAVVDALQLCFPVINGIPTTVGPVRLAEVGPPTYYGSAGNLAALPLTFAVRYWQPLS